MNEQIASPSTNGDETLTWQVRQWEKEPHKRYGVLACACFAGLVGWFMFQNLVMVVIGIAAIAGATTDFWLPIRYQLGRTRASQKCGFSTSAIDWDAVKRVIVCEDGVKLSPLVQSGRMSPFRGIYLRYDSNRESVLEYIKESVGEECSIFGEKN